MNVVNKAVRRQEEKPQQVPQKKRFEMIEESLETLDFFKITNLGRINSLIDSMAKSEVGGGLGAST